MKSIIIMLASLVIYWVATAFCQQSKTGAENAVRIQWNSHQMNQPAPPRYNLSRERVDDIRRLYDQAIEESRSAKPQEPLTPTPPKP